jgi:hypothetical protein
VAVINGRLYAFLQSPFEKNGRSTPVLEMDTATRQSLGLKSYDFHLNDGDLKIGDATPLADGSLLVLEQDGKKQRVIYRWWPDGGKSELVVELAKHADFIKPEKMEGLAMVDETTLVLVNDDDFGLASDQGVPPHLYVVRLPKALPVAPCRR